MTILTIVIIIAVIITIVLIWSNRQGLGVNDYFRYAVRVWIFIKREDAKIAALAAAKVADVKLRESMLNFLSAMASDFEKMFPNQPEWERHRGRLLKLAEEITARNWTIQDAAEEKNRLSQINPEYLKALNKADAKVFIRQYPDFFKYG